MNKKMMLLGAGMLLAAVSASAQKRVTGKVTDTGGQPVMGAVVRVPGTKLVTTTDAEGNFTLSNVPSSAKNLSVSNIGMQSQVVSVAGNVNVVLKDNELGEAVVVGYGTARKVGTVVGSVAKVTSESVNDKPVVNVADALQGKVAGLQILNNSGDAGSVNNATIRVRGTGSLLAGNDPLVVIDGTPVGTSALSMLSSNDIESVTTLKDASATSIYGSRASNGVIYVTTKKGRKSEKGQVTIGQKIGWSQLAGRIGNPANSAEALYFKVKNNVITAEDYQRFKTYGANTDWQKALFDDAAPMYQTDFSVRGGTERTSYYVSGSYLDNTGVDKVSYMKRYTLRANLESKVLDWLTFGLNQAITYSDRTTNGFTVSGSGNVYSYTNMVMTMPTYYDPYHPSVQETHQWYLSPGVYSPLFLCETQPHKASDIVYNGSAFLQIQPVAGLTIKSQLGVYATNTNSKSNVLLEFPGNDPADPKIERSRSDVRDAQWTITNTVEYRKKFAEDHELTLLAGQEGIKYNYSGFSATASGSTDNRLLLLPSMTTVGDDLPSEVSSENKFLSFFGRVDYGFKDKYFANFTVRNDRSSRFGSKNRSAMFYSGGLLWNMKMENWLRPAYWLTDLSVRASVGSTGNSSIGGDYLYYGLVGAGQYDGNMSWGLSQPANEELGWEKQIQFNIGFAATLFGKLTVDFNWYNRKTKDMLMVVPLPYTTGFAEQMLNIGELTNRGIELSVDYDIVRNHDWYVSFHTNYAYNLNKIDKLFYGYDIWPMSDKLLAYRVDKSVNFYMPLFAGVDRNDGRPMWYKVGHSGKAVHDFNPETMTKDNSNMEALNQDTGKRYYAPHTGGFGFVVSWKGLSLNADFAYVLGKYMVDNTYMWATDRAGIMNDGNLDRDMLHIWEKPGDVANMPAFEYNTPTFDTRVLKNASFMRLKNLTLSYDLPKRWMDATHFLSGVRLSFTGRNLFTVTKYDGIDPELATNISRGNYPATRQYVLGVDVTF